MKKIHGSFFIETSSLNGQNIDEVFIYAMRKVVLEISLCIV